MPIETFKADFGRLAGIVAAPAAYVGSLLRHARVFHPNGELCQATIVSDGEGAWAALGDRLMGKAVVRLSGGIWKREATRFEILGCAIRLPGDHGDQDLIFATFRHLWTLPFAVLSTDGSDYFRNTYRSGENPDRIRKLGFNVWRGNEDSQEIRCFSKFAIYMA